MKIKGQKSKLKVYIPNDIDRAIDENARHFVNECGRVVRTRAPLNVKNWKEAFAVAGDGMWKKIQVTSLFFLPFSFFLPIKIVFFLYSPLWIHFKLGKVDLI